MNAKEIARIIKDNKEDIVFLIGNGIHRYKDQNQTSWRNLLIALWNKYSSDQITEIPDDISYPEFYDALELEVLQSINNSEFLNKIRSTLSPKLTKYNFNHNIEEVIKLSRMLNFYQSELSSGYDQNLLELIGFQGNQHEQKELLDEIGKKFSYKTLKILSLQLIKEGLCDSMKNWTTNQYIMKIVNCMESLKTPVLTTNYDMVLEKDTNLIAYNFKKPNRSFGKIYPWNTVYKYKRDSSASIENFGIWHIHGTIEQPKSIKLGLSDYAGCISITKNILYGNKSLFVETLPNLNDEWDGKNTWLDLFFKKKLFIFGLGLGKDETFLRWLLIQRARYMKENNNFNNESGWYCYTNKNKLDNAGAKFYFEKVQLVPIEVTYEDMFENVWNEL